MKQFILRHRKNIFAQALISGGVLSLFIYAVFRILLFEFHMTWIGEITFFLKTNLLSSFLVFCATGGTALAYRSFLKRMRKA